MLEILFLLLLLAAAAATILFWAAAAAIAIAIGAAIGAVLQLIWWLVTRPVVWPFQALAWLIRGTPNRPPLAAPTRDDQDHHGRFDRLERLKALLDSGAISPDEYNRLKAQILT